MASSFNGYFAAGGGGSGPIGSLMSGFGLLAPEYERLDGHTVLRATYPDLSLKFPIGKLTPTIRTLAGNPTVLQVISTANHFVAAGANTANAVQFSADGATWATAATAVATTVSALVATVARLVALNSTASQPSISNSLAPSGVWSLTTGGPVSVAAGTSLCRLCYSPTLGLVVACSATQVYTLADGATAWTLRAPTSSTARQGACWTGTRFVAISAVSAVINLSTDGATWTDSTLLEATSTGQGNIASNGSGTVVVSGSPSGLQVSTDHGLTWSIAQITGLPASDQWRVQFSDGRFFIPTTSGLAMSINGVDWFMEPTQTQAMVVAVGVAKKGTTVVEIPGIASTLAYSFAESSTEYPLPILRGTIPVASGNPLASAALYIKAQ